MITGLERTLDLLSGKTPDRPVVIPILHSGLAACMNIPLGKFFTDVPTMVQVMTEGFHLFGLDGIQLSLGVTLEAEAMGAATDQPPNSGPILREHLLADLRKIEELKDKDPVHGGKVPLFVEATSRIVDQIGDEGFVMVTLRGPLLMASQLRGTEQLLMDLIEAPDAVNALLDLTTTVCLRLARHLLKAGSHGLILGEATCSPNFISPHHYRNFVQPCHRRLITQLRTAGWRTIGLHICGNTLPIIEGVIATGADLLDLDYQVPVMQAITLAGNRIAFRGNLDPSAVLRFSAPADIEKKTVELCRMVAGMRWIISSGCDIPPGTPAANIQAMANAVKEQNGSR